MKKTFSLIAAFIITIFALPFGDTALADGKNYDNIENGDHTITAKALNADKDEASGAANFINEEAILSVQDGEFKLTITIPHNDMAEVTGLQIEGIKPTKNGENWTYALSELKSELNSTVSYEAPSFNMVHDDVPFRFVLEGLDDLPIKEVPSGEDSDKDTDGKANGSENDSNDNEQDGSDKNANTGTNESNDEKNEVGISNPDKTYKTEYITDSESTKQNFNNPVKLLIKDGKKYIEMTGTGGQFIKSLTVNGDEVTWLENNDDGTFVIQFALPGKLTDNIDFGMTISPPGMKDMIHSVDMSFKDPTKDSEKKPVQKPKEEKPKNDDSKKDPAPKPKKKPKTENLSAPDKAYKIDYIVKHATKNEASAADNFFQKPAHLLYKDGVKYLQLTVTNSDMIKSLKTDNGDVLIVKENSDGSMVIQFKVDGDLSNGINLNMFISVPDMPGAPGGYDMEHDARLFLDPSSKLEVDASEFSLVAGSKDNLNGPIIKGSTPGKTVGENNGVNGVNNNGNNNGKGVNHKIPGKPTFGTNGDVNGNGETPVAGNKTGNPQTGDTSNILALSLLLIGSLVPLAIKARRRFV